MTTTDTDEANPFVKPVDEDLSIIGTILDLDEIMSADIRRAERTITIYTRPDIEADIDVLEAELIDILGPEGQLPADVDESLSDSGAARAFELANMIEDRRKAMIASGRQMRFRQLTDDDWTAFQTKHRKSLEAGPPYPDEMWIELVSKCAIAPPLTEDQVKALRGKLGAPVLHQMSNVCLELNSNSGVSVPKSRLSSLVQRQQKPDES